MVVIVRNEGEQEKSERGIPQLDLTRVDSSSLYRPSSPSSLIPSRVWVRFPP